MRALWAACLLAGFCLAVRPEAPSGPASSALAERAEQASGGFPPALAYRASADGSELLILGSKHEADFDGLAWRPALEVELLRFEPSSAFFENDNIMKFFRAIVDLKELDGQAAQIKARDTETTPEENLQRRQAWLEDLHRRQAVADAVHKEGPMALKVGVDFERAVMLVEVYRQQIEGILRGVDATLWQKMEAADAEIEMLEDSAVSNEYLRLSTPDVEHCGGEENVTAAFRALQPAYMAGDIDRLGLISNVAVCVMEKAMHLEKRNEAWARRVLQSRPRRGLVVVGLAHLYDPGDTMSMLHVFAKNGYELEPVELKPTLPVAGDTPEEVSQEVASVALRGLRGIGGGIGISAGV